MTVTKQIISTSFILSSLFVSGALAADGCPELAGTYENGKETITISEKKSESQYQVILGEGAFEMEVDGKTHPTPDGAAHYQAWCAHDALNVKITAGPVSGGIKYYFKDSQTLIEENSGMENSVRSWTRK